MITVTQLPDGRLSLKSHYFYRHRIRNIPTSIFDPDTKRWIIMPSVLGMLEHDFQGELVYKTPRWVILGEPMPDMSYMYQITDKSIQAPALTLPPYDYQDYGIRFMIDKILQHGFVLNADGVGLGKTIQTLGTVKWFVENKGINKILIICKKSIKKQWSNEILKFTDLGKYFDIIRTKTTTAQKRKAYDAFRNAAQGILITNYHTFLNDTKEFMNMGIDFVVIDEVHSVKARNGKLNNNIASVVKGKPTVLLTGTPIMSRPEDIFGVIQLVCPGYFGTWTKFAKEFIVYDINGKFGVQAVGAKNLDKLRSMVQDILIRRTEYEVQLQLPSTIITKIPCDMDSVQEKIIQEIGKQSEMIEADMDKLKIKDQSGNMRIPPQNQAKADILEGRLKGFIAARQAAATDPRLFLTSNSKMMRDTFGVMVPASYKMSGKSEAIIEQVEDIVNDGDKVIMFTKFRTCAVMVKNDIKKVLKIPAILYTGQENEEQRENAIDLFWNDPGYPVIIGTEALAEGVNLQIAKYVINIDQPDTYAIKVQRIGRARRAGSVHGSVVVYDMVTESTDKARSKDEERLENIEQNKDLTDALVSIDEAQRQALVKAMTD